MDLVDPFIPQPQRPRARLDRTRISTSRPAISRTPSRGTRIDFTVRSRNMQPRQLPSQYHAQDTFRRAAAATMRPVAAVPRLVRRTFVPPPPTTGKRVKAGVQYAAVMVWTIFFGFGANVLEVGELAIGIYALVVLVLRFGSHISFMLALLAFVAIVILEVAMPLSPMSSNFAVYAFLLLLIGAMQLGLEIRQQARWQKRRRN